MRLVTFIESFLRIHYKILISKYEFKLYYQVLKDIRNEIMNIIKGVYFNIPQISNVVDINNLDEYVYKRSRLLQSRTYRYLKTLYQKNKSYLGYRCIKYFIFCKYKYQNKPLNKKL